jgi:hypothetical protein
MEMQLRKARLDEPQEFFVPYQRQEGMMAALEEDLRSAEGDQFLEFAGEFGASEQESVGRAWRPVEGAEAAAAGAEVGVVYIAVEDEGGDGPGMAAELCVVGSAAEIVQFGAEEEAERGLRREAASGGGAGEAAGEGSGHEDILPSFGGGRKNRGNRPRAARRSRRRADRDKYRWKKIRTR